MTPDEAAAAAVEAAARAMVAADRDNNWWDGPFCNRDHWREHARAAIAAVAPLIAAAERERIARLLEEPHGQEWPGEMWIVERIAAAIRARTP